MSQKFDKKNIWVVLSSQEKTLVIWFAIRNSLGVRAKKERNKRM